jgi:hypothetical protein
MGGWVGGWLGAWVGGWVVGCVGWAGGWKDSFRLVTLILYFQLEFVFKCFVSIFIFKNDAGSRITR